MDLYRQKLSSKLAIDSQEILSKACELERLLSIKSSSSVPGLNSQAIYIVCLEIAAGLFDKRVKQDEAAKLAGLSKVAYRNSLKILQSILGTSKTLSLNELCIQFGCTSCLAQASKLLSKVQDQVDCSGTSQPVYAAAALYVVAKSQKIRLNRTKLVTVVGSKRALFDRLVNMLLPLHTGSDAAQVPDDSTPSDDDIENQPFPDCTPQKEEQQPSGNEQENYEEWKKRIIDAAQRQLQPNDG